MIEAELRLVQHEWLSANLVSLIDINDSKSEKVNSLGDEDRWEGKAMMYRTVIKSFSSFFHDFINHLMMLIEARWQTSKRKV